MIGTILVPLDGSPLAEQGMYAACRLARETQSELLLLTAVPFSVHAGAEMREKERAALMDARSHLRYQQQALEAQGIASRTLLLPGDPVRAIIFAAENEGVSLISMATHGRSGLQQALLGSVAAAVVRDTHLPVLLSRAPEWPLQHKVSAYRRIVVPLDGTPFAEAALDYVEANRLGCAGEVLLLRVVERAYAQPISSMAPGDEIVALYEAAEQETERRQREADTYLRELAAGRADDRAYRLAVAVGPAAEAITGMIREDQADLVVMATHGRHGVDRLLHGSVARSLLLHTGVPMLLLHGATTAPETAATE